MENNLKRRDFIKRSAMAGVGIAVGSVALAEELQQKLRTPVKPVPVAKPMEKVRIGYVGAGGMGTAHISNLLKIKGAELVAVCDVVEDRVKRAQEMTLKAGQPKPEGYFKDEYDFKRLCQRDDIDLVYTATPWEWHVPVCIEAMKNGKHAATEVPAAYTIDDCWNLIEVSEKTGKYCIMMENCNYDKIEMMILNMVKKNLFGELLYAECGYLHDLRGVKHDMNGEGVWRRAHSMKRNGDHYPTHGLGPIMQCFDINRGNYFDYLVSFGTKTRGLHLYAEKRFGPDSPQAKEKFVLSDIVTTVLKTMNGETIVLTHDTSSPRPYSRNILVQGTGGIVRKYPESKIYIEKEGKPDAWEKVDEYLKEFEHPVWKELEEQSKGAGHGGMDYIEDYRLVNALLKGVEPDMDVYDAAVMSAVCELSDRSIKQKSAPQKFPDFTRGLWKKQRELPVMKVK
ncbi:MAG: Gfo/Idh/MocA family oxidoreductase [Melioribacteraceae bacterium]